MTGCGCMWAGFALLSALFAALTSILAKLGMEGINSNLATAIRTAVVLVMAWGIVFLTGKHHGIGDIGGRSWIFLILSGVATGLSWLCYYRALQLGIRFFLLKPIKYEDIIETFSAIRQQLDEKNGISDEIMEKSSSEDFISKAQNYIRENYKTVTLTSLSKEFFMNSSYVSQIFKQRTGQNFSEYLTQVRMQKAVQLLATTDEKIYVISAEVGYANTKYFIRAFRSYYRMSPSEYREQNQNT